MEYLSLPHTIDALQKLSPEPGDTLISNLHEPLLTLLEDTSPPATTVDSSSSSSTASIPLRHGTILPACDPTTYKNLAGPDSKGEEHGSCAENLVLALQEFNKSTGLKGARTVGADVTLNSAPVPLSLFMNTSVRQQGQDSGSSSSGSGNVVVEEPRKFEGGKWGKGGEKGGWIKFKAERDVVVIMSACPMDVGPTNGGRCMAANFVVEEPVCEEKVEEEEEEEEGEKGEEEGEKGEEKGKAKAKVQTVSEQINGKKVEAKKAQTKKDVKKPAATAAASATPAPNVKGKRRDSAHGVGEGAQPKVKKTPAEDRAKSPTENTAKAVVENKTKTPVESRAKTPVENRAKTPVENRAKTPVENKAKSPVENRAKSPVERVKSPFGNIVKNPFENRAKSPVSGVQSPRTGASTPCSEAIRNMPRPGKKKPKKLERRSSSKAPV